MQILALTQSELDKLFALSEGNPQLDLSPLYRIDASSDLQETILGDWPGFGGEGPVRLGKGAHARPWISLNVWPGGRSPW